MKKKSIAARLGAAALALTLVTTSLSSGTLAKFTSQFGAQGSFEVANWNVHAGIAKTSTGANEWTMVADDTLPLMKLFETAAGVNSKGGTTNGTVTNYKIAPGMSGGFYINVGTASEEGVATDVKTYYRVYIRPKTAGQGTVPEHFTMYQVKADNSHGDDVDLSLGESDWDSDLGMELAKGSIDAGALSASAKQQVHIEWSWPYETGTGDEAVASNDEIDVQNASAANKNVGFEIFVQFIQANPDGTAPSGWGEVTG